MDKFELYELKNYWTRKWKYFLGLIILGFLGVLNNSWILYSIYFFGIILSLLNNIIILSKYNNYYYTWCHAEIVRQTVIKTIERLQSNLFLNDFKIYIDHQLSPSIRDRLLAPCLREMMEIDFKDKSEAIINLRKLKEQVKHINESTDDKLSFYRPATDNEIIQIVRYIGDMEDLANKGYEYLRFYIKPLPTLYRLIYAAKEISDPIYCETYHQVQNTIFELLLPTAFCIKDVGEILENLKLDIVSALNDELSSHSDKLKASLKKNDKGEIP
jgi:hypothetical protein